MNFSENCYHTYDFKLVIQYIDGDLVAPAKKEQIEVEKRKRETEKRRQEKQRAIEAINMDTEGW